MSAVEDGHAGGVAAGARRGLEPVEAVDLLGRELDGVGGDVHFGPGHASGARRRTPTRQQQISTGLRQTIDAMSTVPVFIQNGRLDAVATNRLGHALFSERLTAEHQPVNSARFVFLDL